MEGKIISKMFLRVRLLVTIRCKKNGRQEGQDKYFKEVEVETEDTNVNQLN